MADVLDEHVAEAVARSRSCTVTTSRANGVDVVVVNPPRAARHCMALLGYGGRLDAFEVQRYAILAALLRTRFAVVETPGAASRAFRTTRADRRALAGGDFATVAHRARTSSATALSLGKGESLHVLGYSMGASLAAQVDSVASRVLVEPVGTVKWRLSALSRAMRAEQTALVRHLAETERVPTAAVPSRPRCTTAGRLDQVLMPVALCRSRIDDRSFGTEPLMIVRADRSRVVAAAAAESLADAIRASGRAVTAVTVSGGHAFWHSWPCVVGLADDLSKFWDAT